MSALFEKIGRPLVVACLNLALVAVYLPATLKRSLTGDEPHYLVMAASLAWDQDLDLANDYASGNSSLRLPGAAAVADPHVIVDAFGRWWPQHEPGFPALLAPWLRLAGIKGVWAFLALVYMGLGVALQGLGRALGLQSRTLGALAALLCSVAPLPYYALQLFPESTAAFIATVFALSLAGGSPSARKAFLLGALVGLLPWLRLRFLPAFVAAVTSAPMFWKPRAARAFLFAAAVIAGGEAAYFVALFGRPVPPAAAHHGFGTVGEAACGVLGLFLDGQVGLLVLSPVFILAAAFLKRVFPPGSPVGFFFLVALLGTVLFSGSYKVWTGGWCPQPARHLVHLLPLALLPVAEGLTRLQGPRLLLARLLWVFSALLPLVYTFAPGATYTGLAYRWLEEKTSLPLSRFFPSLKEKELFFGTIPENLTPLLCFLPLVIGLAVVFAQDPGNQSSPKGS